ncbi:MAG: deoxyribose-phosphate aldolase, partial [Deltaproteobacteria bacterium]
MNRLIKRAPSSLASYIDHTLLKPDASRLQLDQLCNEAVEHHFFAVCVNSSNVRYVVEKLRGSSVKTAAVVGFPLGASATVAKVVEAQEAIRQGAEEIDMVLNIGALKDRNYRLVLADIAEVVRASKPYPVKIIFETSMLERDEKIIACVLSQLAGAAFVKTSTGFGPGGATIEDVKLMRQ